MRNQEKCARNRQVHERTCIKQSDFIKEGAIALGIVMAGYLVVSLGFGVVLGVI